MIILWLNFILLIVSFFLIFFVKKINSKLIIYDEPDNNRKIHSIPVPLFGGIIFLIFLITNTILSYEYLTSSLKLITILIFLYSIFFIIGFIDDRTSLSPSKKTFALLIFLTLLIPLHEDLIIRNLIFKDLEFYIPLNQANIFFTIFCLYFFYNIINFSDGANGITISLSIYWLLVFIFFGSINKIFIYSLIAPLILILIFNLKNKIFLGNSGSSLLSITLGILFIINYNIDNSIKCDEIFLLMFIPAIDTIRVTIDRTLDGKSPFQPDQKHLHHLLLKIIDKNFVFFPYIIISILPFLLSIYVNTVLILFLFSLVYLISVSFLKRI
tara:strand:- start:313 stop:1293 length:981 start_codon:yes stop_codon:yes gene_type:complete